MVDSLFLTTILLMLIGIGGTLFKRNLIKIAISLNIVSAGVNLFFIGMGYRKGGTAPIFTNAPGLNMVSPTPQALILTNIVIDLAVTAFLLSLAILIEKTKKEKEINPHRK